MSATSSFDLSYDTAALFLFWRVLHLLSVSISLEPYTLIVGLTSILIQGTRYTREYGMPPFHN